MAVSATTLSNSLSGQIDEFNNEFYSIRQAAQTFEKQQAKANTLLYGALAELFAFGEKLMEKAAEPGTSVIREFLLKNGVAFNARTQANPYIGLVKLAFAGSTDSSRSQYSTVLHYASSQDEAHDDFKAWIADGGIEGRRAEAVEAQGKTGATTREHNRDIAIRNARTAMSERAASEAVALPEGIKAPEGFAIFLASVDGSNNAKIIHLIDADATKVNAQILKLVKEKSEPITDGVLSFLRAVQIIVDATPDKIGKESRDILVRNTMERGSPVAHLQTASKAYSFPGAHVRIANHIGQLKQDEDFVLNATDAKLLADLAGKHDNWAVSDMGAISADGLPVPFQLTHMTNADGYRVPKVESNDDKAIAASADQIANVIGYIQHQRTDIARKNKDRKAPVPFSDHVLLRADANGLFVTVPPSDLTSTLATTAAELEIDELVIGTRDIEDALGALAKHELNADGWLMDSEVDNAALVFDATLDSDRLRLILPTQIGNAYNQVCEAL